MADKSQKEMFDREIVESLSSWELFLCSFTNNLSTLNQTVEQDSGLWHVG